MSDVYERLSKIDSDGDEVDLTDAVVDGLADATDRDVKLADGLTFHDHDSNSARVIDPTGDEREDLDVVTGVIEHDGHRALSVLGTPELDADTPVGFGDHVSVDLTCLDALLQPGDPLFPDYGFLQSYPEGDDAADAESTGLELLASRIEDERFGFLGEEIDGEAEILLYSSQPGQAVEGST